MVYELNGIMIEHSKEQTHLIVCRHCANRSATADDLAVHTYPGCSTVSKDCKPVAHKRLKVAAPS